MPSRSSVCQQKRRYAFGLDIQVQADPLLASYPKASSNRGMRMPVKRSPIHAPVSSSSSSSEDVSSTVPMPLVSRSKKVVVIENKLSVQRLSDVDFDDVATHARGEGQRLQCVLRHIAVRCAVADELHRSPLKNSSMSRRDCGH